MKVPLDINVLILVALNANSKPYYTDKKVISAKNIQKLPFLFTYFV